MIKWLTVAVSWTTNFGRCCLCHDRPLSYFQTISFSLRLIDPGFTHAGKTEKRNHYEIFCQANVTLSNLKPLFQFSRTPQPRNATAYLFREYELILPSLKSSIDGSIHATCHEKSIFSNMYEFSLLVTGCMWIRQFNFV